MDWPYWDLYGAYRLNAITSYFKDIAFLFKTLIVATSHLQVWDVIDGDDINIGVLDTLFEKERRDFC